MTDVSGAAAAASTKEAVALAIRRRNGLQMSATHSAQQTSRTNTAVATPDVDITRKLSFSAALHDTADDDSDDTVDANKVQIVIRIRPLIGDAADSTDASSTTSTTNNNNNDSNNRRDSTGDSTECFRVVSTTSMLAQPPKTSQAYRSTGTATAFQFSRIFTATTAQRELFVATTKPVLRAAFDGKSGLVFAYGVTNSGKTYTIRGTSARPGVLPRALAFVIKELARRKENDVAPVTHVTASYLEVYNENVYDLLAAPGRKRRALRLQDCDGAIQVKGLLEKPLRTPADAAELLALGLRNKQVAETRCNSDSSRSHCVFTLQLYQTTPGSSSSGGRTLRSKVSIVDLAGSERSAKSGATGLRMQEASKINGSLMNLMRCLETLRWNQQHPPALHKMVPFRESKLTRLFQENLVGKALGPLVMIVAVNPSSHEFDETLRTLKYSAVARELVPMQSRPALTRAQARRAGGAQAFVYDLDGRLTKKQRLSVETETPRKPLDAALASASATKPAVGLRLSVKRARDAALGSCTRTTTTKRVAAVAADTSSSNVVLQQSPGPVKTKTLSDDDDVDRNDTDDSRSQRTAKLDPAVDAHQEFSTATQTPQPVSADAVARLHVAYHEMEIRVTELEVENDDLRRQLSAVNAEKLELEVAIRAEIGKQMHEQLQQIRAQYQDMAKQTRSGGSGPIGVSNSESARKAMQVADERAALQLQVRQLQLQLNECEDEMERVRTRHELALDELRDPVKREQ